MKICSITDCGKKHYGNLKSKIYRQKNPEYFKNYNKSHFQHNKNKC